MRLAFPTELTELHTEFERVLADLASSSRARAAAASKARWDQPLWRQLAELGWFGMALPASIGGQGLDPMGLCLLGEAFGKHLAAIPFASSVLGFADAVGDAPGLVDGSMIGGVLPASSWTQLTVSAGLAHGQANAVADGHALTHVLTMAGDALVVIDLANAVRRDADSLDRINLACAIEFANAPVTVLASGGTARARWERILARHAIFLAFVQLGGAGAALDAARSHVIERYAFGRSLGSFQAVKHALADLLASIEIARSNAWLAAASLEQDNAVLAQAAAAARVAATHAHRQAARALVHFQGGLGVTAESDAQLHYRRAQALGLVIGSASEWREQFIASVLREAA